LPTSGYSFGIIKLFLCAIAICDQMWHRDIKCPLKNVINFVFCHMFQCIWLYDLPNV
jgi:hypothetical protein